MAYTGVFRIILSYVYESHQHVGVRKMSFHISLVITYINQYTHTIMLRDVMIIVTSM
jgi:hypothetical protein